MRATTFTPICFAFAAMLSAAAPAMSEMYRWVDDAGAVHYSNTPPENARDLTLIDDATNAISSTEKRTREILEFERQASPLATRDPASAEAVGPPSTNPAEDALEAPARAGISPLQPEAVQDPCLRSSDPKCYERNRASYVPYRGYAPSAAGQLSLTGVGATSAGASGGTLAGSAPLPPPKLVAPKASSYALPPGSDIGAAGLPPLTPRR